MEYDFCENYKSTDEIVDLFIGYARNSFPLFLIIPSLSIVTNLFIIWTHLKRRYEMKKNQVSMEKMFLILTIFEVMLSFYWLFSGIFFYKAKQMSDNCGICFFLSMISIFLHSCDWIFLTFTIHNLMKIITDPIEGILRYTARLRLYLLATFIISSAITILSYMAKVFGRSPMLTCFIRTEFYDTNQTITLSIFLLLPFSFILYSFYLCIKMCCNKKLRGDKNLSNLYYKYMAYISVYFIFNAPMIVLYVLTIKRKISPDTFLSWLSFTSCSMTASISLVLTLVRLLQGYVKINFFDNLNCCRKNKNKITTARESLLHEGGLRRTMTKEEQFVWLEKKILENFMRDLFVGICYFIKNSKIVENKKDIIERLADEKIYKKDCLATNDTIIDESNINFEDEDVKNSGMLEVEFTEYAPKVFNKLRKLENLDEEELIK